jgi:hypothetical protein
MGMEENRREKKAVLFYIEELVKAGNFCNQERKLPNG